MSLTLPAVPDLFLKPRFDDRIAQNIQVKLATLPWLDRVYHIARVGIISKDKLSYPQIQSNNSTSKAFDIRPDNRVGAYSFFEVNKPYELNTYEGVSSYFLSLIVWANLNKITPPTTTDITGDLIRDVIKKIELCGGGEFVVEERPEEIFSNYSGLTQEKGQHLMRRYAGFKIEFKVVSGTTSDC